MKPCIKCGASDRYKSGVCRPCTSNRSKTRYAARREYLAPKILAQNKKYYAENRNVRRAFYLMREARKRASKKKIPFNLNRADVATLQILIDIGHCQITGLPFVLGGWEPGKRRSPFSPSLDRIKPELGYVHGNVRVVLWGLNAGLGDWGADIYEAIARTFLQHRRFPWEI